MNVTTTPQQPPCIAYLAVAEDPLHGFTGGLLVVSSMGRPLEFHCSTPLTPTRAQQILYGPTLRPHICGELIAGALLAAAKLKPGVLLIEEPSTAPPEFAGVTLVVSAVQPDDVPGAAQGIVIADSLLTPVGGEPIDSPALLESLSTHVALAEPFERVHDAIREAQRIGGEETPAAA